MPYGLFKKATIQNFKGHISIVKGNPNKAKKKQKANAKCACGSGNKFKKCCKKKVMEQEH